MPSEESERETLHCPECGHDGAFDGMGYEYREKTTIDQSGEQETVLEARYRHHCGECGGEFLTVEGNESELLTVEAPDAG